MQISLFVDRGYILATKRKCEHWLSRIAELGGQPVERALTTFGRCACSLAALRLRESN